MSRPSVVWWLEGSESCCLLTIEMAACTKREEMNSTNFKQHFYLPLSQSWFTQPVLLAVSLSPVFIFGNFCLGRTQSLPCALPRTAPLWESGKVELQSVAVILTTILMMFSIPWIMNTLKRQTLHSLFSFRKNCCFMALGTFSAKHCWVFGFNWIRFTNN